MPCEMKRRRSRSEMKQGIDIFVNPKPFKL